MFRSLYARLMSAYFIIILVTLIILSLLLSTFFQNYILDQRKVELIKEANVLNPYIERFLIGYMDEWSLNNIFKTVDRYKYTTIWVVDPLGKIRISYSTEGQNTDKWKDLKLSIEEFDRVLNGNTIVRIGRFGDRFPGPVLTVGVPLKLNRSIEGAIFIHSPVEEIRSTLKDIYINIWWAAFTSAILSVLLLYWVSRKISRPLIQMNQISREIAMGDFRRRIKIASQDEIGQLAVNFNAMTDSLEKLEEMRRSFVANVSHELRSPLTSIRGYIQGVLDDTIGAQDHKRYLSVALEETERLSKLINELLDLSQIEAGQFPLNLSVFDLNELIRRILVGLEENIIQKEMDVKVQFEEEQCWVEADPDRIQQVVLNLLDNAVKFNREEGNLFIRTWKNGDKVYTKIQDEGQGISKEDIVHIWERFYQVDKSRSPNRGGTGLGLSIVKKIIEEHHQSIWVNSKLGMGTAFIFSLKAAKKNEKNH